MTIAIARGVGAELGVERLRRGDGEVEVEVESRSSL